MADPLGPEPDMPMADLPGPMAAPPYQLDLDAIRRLPDPYPERRLASYCWRSWPPRHTDTCGCPEPMPAMFEPLATYNAERARGIVHTPEWDAAMVALQCRFNEWAGL